jgi:hypothetical protein
MRAAVPTRVARVKKNSEEEQYIFRSRREGKKGSSAFSGGIWHRIYGFGVRIYSRGTVPHDFMRSQSLLENELELFYPLCLRNDLVSRYFQHIDVTLDVSRFCEITQTEPLVLDETLLIPTRAGEWPCAKLHHIYS